MISWFVSLSPAWGSVLIAQSLEPASDSLSLSLPLPHLHSISLSLSKININKQTKKDFREQIKQRSNAFPTKSGSQCVMTFRHRIILLWCGHEAVVEGEFWFELRHKMTFYLLLEKTKLWGCLKLPAYFSSSFFLLFLLIVFLSRFFFFNLPYLLLWLWARSCLAPPN